MPLPQPYEIKEFNTAADFVAALDIDNPAWRTDDDSARPWVFRGQPDATKTLRPSAWRTSPEVTEFFARFRPFTEFLRARNNSGYDGRPLEWRQARAAERM